MGIKKNFFGYQKNFFFRYSKKFLGGKNFFIHQKKFFYSFNFLFNIKNLFFEKKNYFSDYGCIASNKKMNSSESEQFDNENSCNEFLFAKGNRYEWKQLEINGVENIL